MAPVQTMGQLTGDVAEPKDFQIAEYVLRAIMHTVKDYGLSYDKNDDVFVDDLNKYGSKSLPVKPTSSRVFASLPSSLMGDFNQAYDCRLVPLAHIPGKQIIQMAEACVSFSERERKSIESNLMGFTADVDTIEESLLRHQVEHLLRHMANRLAGFFVQLGITNIMINQMPVAESRFTSDRAGEYVGEAFRSHTAPRETVLYVKNADLKRLYLAMKKLNEPGRTLVPELLEKNKKLLQEKSALSEELARVKAELHALKSGHAKGVTKMFEGASSSKGTPSAPFVDRQHSPRK